MQQQQANMDATQSEAQKAFDERYITSAEIQRDLAVSRTSILNARRRGLLPEPIVINGNQIFIWERVTVMEGLHAWRHILGVRRSPQAKVQRSTV